MEKISINFGKVELDSNYEDLIYDAIKYHLVGDRNVQYTFPQIKKGGVSLKNRVSKKLEKLPICGEYNVGFVSTKTQEAIFKIIILH